jgi:CubicO group peptidase (beta-lactamase class C family)
MVRLVHSMLPGGPPLLKPGTIGMMSTNQLPDGMWVEFPNMPPFVGRGFGLGSSVAVQPGPYDPKEVTGEVSWGGLAGTVWWFNPRLDIAGVLMTQRYYGQGGLHTIAFRKEAYRALGY